MPYVVHILLSRVGEDDKIVRWAGLPGGSRGKHASHTIGQVVHALVHLLVAVLVLILVVAAVLRLCSLAQHPEHASLRLLRQRRDELDTLPINGREILLIILVRRVGQSANLT